MKKQPSKAKVQPKEKAPKGPKQLTAKEQNRYEIEQQLIKIRLLQNALKFIDPRGRHMLFGIEVSAGDIVRAQEKLKELDRVRGVYESDAYQKKQLPYLPSNGSHTDKVKAHFDELDGELLFFEVKPSTSGRIVVEHSQTKTHINKHIKKKIMATKTAKKKAAPKKAAKKAAPKKKEGVTIKSFVEAQVAKGADNAKIFEALNKAGMVYSEASVRWYASKARA